MFFSTPHRGINLQRFADSLRDEDIHVNAQHSFVQALEQNSHSMQAMSFRFRHICSKVQILSFYEQYAPSRGSNDLVSSFSGLFQTLCLNKMINTLDGINFCVHGQTVSRFEAVMDHEREKQIPLNATHSTMCRFESTKDPNYQFVKEQLVRLIEGTYL